MTDHPGNNSRAATSLHKMLQLIGLAARGRRLVIGSDAVLDAIRKGSVKLVVLARDAGANAAKKYQDKSAFYHIPFFQALSRDEIGRACGRSQIVVFAVTDPGFAAKMQELLGEINGGEAFDETSSV